MNDTDRRRFAASLAALAETLGGAVGEITAEGYWRGLEDLSIEEVEAACLAAMKTCRFMPKPVELRELAGAGDGGLGVIAWTTFIEAARRTAWGDRAGLDFEDKAINAAVRAIGGIEMIRRSDESALHTFTRKAFIEAYNAYRARPASLAEHGTPLALPSGGGAPQLIPCTTLARSPRALAAGGSS